MEAAWDQLGDVGQRGREVSDKPLTKSGFIIASACKNQQRAKWAILGLFVVAVTSGLLMKMDLWSYFVMAVVVAVSIAIGHWLGQRRRRANHPDDRKRGPPPRISHDDCGFERQSPESFTGAHSIPDRLHDYHHGVFAMASTALGVICPIKNTLCQDRCHAARRLQQIISASSSGQSNVWKCLFRRTFVLGGHFI